MNILDRLRRSAKQRATRTLGLAPETVELPPLHASELARIKKYFGRPKFFILGYPRSGTTLLARLLRTSPEVSCRWQGHFASGADDWIERMGRPELANWLSLRSNRWVEEGPSLTALARITADYVMERIAEEEGARWVGDKTPTPRMDHAVERLHKLYPDAFVIAIVRDGRDAALSQRIQAFIDQPETLSIQDSRIRHQVVNDPEAFGAGKRSIFSESWLSRVAEHWAQSVGAGHERAKMLYGERYRALRYEDLLQDAQALILELWRELGIPEAAWATSDLETAMASNPAADWHRQAEPDLAAQLKRGSQGGWQRWFSEEDIKVFNRYAEAQLRVWGYRD